FVADHFQYLATLAILVPAAVGLTFLSRKGGDGKAARFALPGILLLAMGAATWGQARVYRDYETLFRETLARNPGSAFLHSNLGVRLMSDPAKVPEALSQFQEAVRLEPGNADYHDNLGLALASTPGRLDD